MSLQNQNQSQPPPQRQTKRAKLSKDSIDFCKIGGLNNHLKTLREVIIFPLLHGNVFSHFNIKAPRGVLFYGPPGTGKTLVAAALATEINKEGIGKVAFFQRKGADVLDKWVGGSEKNLRDLFDKATKSRPSIIFFDELDGLAPVRDKQTDQIHSSVVTTLLALMDGLDNKPGVIVIGATNRIEAVDSALRRPGRFDKELYFPLPGAEARREILEVHTVSWKYKPKSKLLTALVEATAGFSGADLQGLCSEAILRCVKRVYPCIKGVKIDPEKLKIEECDFLNARLCLVPSTLKGGQKMRKLTPIIQPLLEEQLRKIMRSIQTIWPHFVNEGYKYIIGEERYAGRILLIGNNMQGLNTHLVPAILQYLEYLPVFIYDITKIYKKNAVTCAQHHFPAVILLTRVDEWWNLIDECEQLSIVSSLEDIHAGLPILVIASCKSDVPVMLQDYFYTNSSISLKIENPTDNERKIFLKPLFFDNRMVSLISVLENSRKNYTKPDIKNVEKEMLVTRRSRKTNKSLGNILTRSKRKRNYSASHSATRKKIKLRESRHELVRSNSASSLYDIHRQIKHENTNNGRNFLLTEALLTLGIGTIIPIYDAVRVKLDTLFYGSALSYQERDTELEARRCDSLSSISPYDNKQYFTKVLSHLLNQRSAKYCSDDGKTSPLKDFLCEKKLKTVANFDDTMTIPSTSKESYNDAQMQQIYNLWKHASLVTSKNMAVAQLELLYDVISACINIHWNSFESLVKNLEDIFTNIEQSYNIRK